MATDSVSEHLVGDIDERGFINNLYRKGFSFDKCISELHANCIDANCSDIKYIEREETIKIVDDGCGMDIEGVKNMFSMYRDNHNFDKSLGVSGMGSKAATCILSGKKNMYIYTKKIDGQPISAYIPWETIFKTGKYSNQIKISLMTQEEIDEFNSDRINTNNCGTTIVFPQSKQLSECIKQQLDPETTNNDLLPTSQLCYIYGKFNRIKTTYVSFTSPSVEPNVLKLYNYFEDNDTKYYQGITECVIKCYKNISDKDDKRFILYMPNGEELESEKYGRGYAKTLTPVIKNLTSYRCYGEFNIKCAIKRDRKYFDETKPVLPSSSTPKIHDYDIEHFDKSFPSHNIYAEFLSKTSIVRNGQVIGNIDLDDFKFSSTRGNAKLMFKTMNVRCIIEYNPISTQDNEMDKLVCVQENKTQLVCNFPVNLTRLISHVKGDKADSVWKYFEKFVHRIKPVEEPVTEELVASTIVEETVTVTEEPVTEETEELVVSTIVEETVTVPKEPVMEVAEEPVTSTIVEETVTVPEEPVTEATEELVESKTVEEPVTVTEAIDQFLNDNDRVSDTSIFIDEEDDNCIKSDKELVMQAQKCYNMLKTIDFEDLLNRVSETPKVGNKNTISEIKKMMMIISSI
jgi:hypothetical protein